MLKRHNEYLQKIIAILSKYPREYYVFGFFGFILFFIVLNLFSFTILNHSYYQDLANRQQTSQVKTPVSR
jgi:cell division protein FtsI/penicillin-binding protein 2